MDEASQGGAAAAGVIFPYDGDDLLVRALPIAGSRKLVVTFSGRSSRPPAPTGFGEEYFLKRRISAVHFISKANHWWQTAELSDAIAAVRAAGLLNDAERITLYGSSMGGFAAMIRSRELSADQIIAVSPQFSINAAVVPFETRWRDYAAELAFEQDDMAAGLDRDIPLWMIVDPLFAPDMGHVRLTEALRPVSRIGVTLAGHNTARALEECGLMRPVLQELLEERFDARAWPMRYRSVREHSCLVWFGLAELLIDQGRSAWAHAPVSLAAEMVVRGANMRDGGLRQQILRLAIVSACARNDAPAALHWLDALQGVIGDGRGLLLPRAQVSLLTGNPAEGLEVLAGMKRLGSNPDAVALQLRLLTATSERTRLARAIEAAARHRHIAEVALASAEGVLMLHGAARAGELAEAALGSGVEEAGLRLMVAEHRLEAGGDVGSVLRPLLRGTVSNPDVRARIERGARMCGLSDEARLFVARCDRAERLYRAARTARSALGPANPADGVPAFREAVRDIIAREATEAPVDSEQPPA